MDRQFIIYFQKLVLLNCYYITICCLFPRLISCASWNRLQLGDSSLGSSQWLDSEIISCSHSHCVDVWDPDFHGFRQTKTRHIIALYIPRTQMTSIFEGQASKTRSFSSKTRGPIWVHTICLNYVSKTPRIGHTDVTRTCCNIGPVKHHARKNGACFSRTMLRPWNVNMQHSSGFSQRILWFVILEQGYRVSWHPKNAGMDVHHTWFVHYESTYYILYYILHIYIYISSWWRKSM